MKTTITLLFILILYFAVDLSGGGDRTGLPAQIRVANDFTGADIGAKINAADAACGANVGCEIWVFDGGSVAANTIRTQITIGSFHTLKFWEGIFPIVITEEDLNTTWVPGEAAIYLKDNANLTGTGWNSVLVENDYSRNQILIPETGLSVYAPSGHTIVGTWSSRFSCSRGANNGTCRSSNIHVSNLKFLGRRQSQFDGGNSASVALSNGYNVSVRNCWFDQTAGYATSFGGTMASPDGDPHFEGETIAGSTGAAQGLVAANYAKDGWFDGNSMNNLQTQWLAVTTAENVRITNNIFREGGKKPFTITSVTNPAGAPVVVTLSEKHHFYDGGGVVLTNVTATNGAPAISNITYRVKLIPGEPFKFSLNQEASNGTYTFNPGTPQERIENTYTAVVNGTGTGSYTTSATSQTDWRNTGTVGIDFEPNGSPYEGVGGHLVANNLFDFRTIHGMIVYTAIIYQVTNSAQDTHSTTITGNTVLGYESGTGAMLQGIGLSTPFSEDVIVTNNYVRGAYGSGISVQGKRLLVADNLLVDCGGDPGGGGSGSLAVFNMSDSTISANRAINPTTGQSYISEGNVNFGNVFQNNIADAHLHSAGSTITNSKYLNNIWAGLITARSGFTETTNSNNNLFDGNISHPRLTSSGALGLVLVGTGSKLLTHKFTDGRTFIPNVITRAFNNPN